MKTRISVRLSENASWMLDEICKLDEMSQSQVVERLLMELPVQRPPRFRFCKFCGEAEPRGPQG